MAIEFFIPLREEAVAIDHAAGIELGGHNTLAMKSTMRLRALVTPVLAGAIPGRFRFRHAEEASYERILSHDARLRLP